MHRPTIRALANAAGVSTATVNRVLAGSANVKLATTQRVKNAARDLGFTGVQAGQGQVAAVKSRYKDVPTPFPGSGQVRIKTHAVALGFVDGLIAAGRYQMIPTLPYTPGGEIGGVVDMLGPGVPDIRPGSRVVTWQLGGGLADYAIVPATRRHWWQVPGR